MKLTRNNINKKLNEVKITGETNEYDKIVYWLTQKKRRILKRKKQ